MTVEIELTPVEWDGLYRFCKGYKVTIRSHISHLVLAEWAESIQPNTLWKWHKRPPYRGYRVVLPASVAVAYWQEAQIQRIFIPAQQVLGKIDKQLKNEGLGDEYP